MDISAGVVVREGKVVRRGPRQVNKKSTFVSSFSLLFFVCKFLFKATATILRKLVGYGSNIGFELIALNIEESLSVVSAK